MPLAKLDAVTYEIGDRPLLKDASLVLERGERVCLIGRNGAGKSTLLRILAGEEHPDEGELQLGPDVRVSQLAQALPDAESSTVRGVVASGLDWLQRHLDAYHRLTEKDLDAAGLGELERLQHRIDAESGWDLAQRVESILLEMGLPAEESMAMLSGGWRRRVALARALIARPEILLLDEPTNHLDLGTIEWLEQRLLGFAGCVLFVTHDRALVGRLATRIVELDRTSLTSWPGDYQNFLRRKEESLVVEQRADAQFDKHLAEEEAWIRQGIRARRTRNEGRVRALEALRRSRRERLEREGTSTMRVQEGASSGRRVIELTSVSHRFGDEILFDDLSVEILRGDRLGLIGNNGVGKTTLLRIMLSELPPDRGVVKVGTRIELAYFDQLRRELDFDKTVAETVSDGSEFITVDGKNKHVIGYLGGFLFSPKRTRSKVGALSGGERNRLVLARLFARPSNLMVLDEPTNDLDLETLEVLEQQLIDYKGTLIVVSHDRAFLDNVVTTTLAFEAGGVVRHNVGGYSDWARQGHPLAVKAVAVELNAALVEPVEANAPEPTLNKASKPRKLSYILQRELDALPERIALLEADVERLEARTGAADFYSQPFDEVQPTLDALEAAKKALEGALERWLELEEEPHRSSGGE